MEINQDSGMFLQQPEILHARIPLCKGTFTPVAHTIFQASELPPGRATALLYR